MRAADPPLFLADNLDELCNLHFWRGFWQGTYLSLICVGAAGGAYWVFA